MYGSILKKQTNKTTVSHLMWKHRSCSWDAGSHPGGSHGCLEHLRGAELQHGQRKEHELHIHCPTRSFPPGIHTCFLKSTGNKNKSQKKKILLISAVKKKPKKKPTPQAPKHLGWRCLAQATPGTEMQAWL